MAWRIANWVLRGQLDNRQRGTVSGRIWLVGRRDPLVLELQGNCRRDLAGCGLEFRRRPEAPTQGLAPGRSALVPHQAGVVGDLTASRKVRVPTISDQELRECLRLGVPFETQTANGLYLEWWSVASGRVVLESTDFELTVSEPAWSMSAAEEKQEARENAERLRRLLDGSIGS